MEQTKAPSTVRFVRSALFGRRCEYVRRVNPASLRPRYSLTALMLVPALERALRDGPSSTKSIERERG
jgi:hypothetical protein